MSVEAPERRHPPMPTRNVREEYSAVGRLNRIRVYPIWFFECRLVTACRSSLVGGVMEDRPQALTAIWEEDPLADLKIGAFFNIEPLIVGGSDAQVVPDAVKNWTFFDGALMVLIVKSADGLTAIGTVVAIAPGLAVGATHTLSRDLDSLVAGESSAFCVGPTERGLELWRVRHLSVTDSDDILYLSLQAAFGVPDGWRLRTLPVTSRAPISGERLTVVGFRMPTASEDEQSIRVEGNLLAASGQVTAVYHPIRDSVLMPFPTIEIQCGALGGMSGGAVLDASGHLVGVVSRSLGTDDGEGPTFAAWIVGCLNREVRLPWPPGLYPVPVHLLDVDSRLLHLEGRDKIRATDPNTTEYVIWFS